MKQLLVTLISDQAIPNVLFVSEMKTIADHYLFLTTEYMEQKGKSEAILNAVFALTGNVIILYPVTVYFVFHGC